MLSQSGVIIKVRIKSNFKDYYDHVATMYGGGDPRVVYPRPHQFPAASLRVEVEGSCPLFDPSRTSWEYQFDYAYLAIAGKCYLMARPHPRDIFASIGEFKVVPPEAVVDIPRRFHFGAMDTVEFGKELPYIVSISQKIQAPVFVIEEIEHTVRIGQSHRSVAHIAPRCPVLTDLGLPAMVSAQQMYQELSYFVGNTMRLSTDVQPPVEVSNRLKIIKAGFDLVQSFRHRK
jgi:hypothetical protein